MANIFAVDDTEDASSAFLGTSFGTGPFVLFDARPNDQVVLVPHDDWWNRSAQEGRNVSVTYKQVHSQEERASAVVGSDFSASIYSRGIPNELEAQLSSWPNVDKTSVLQFWQAIYSLPRDALDETLGLTTFGIGGDFWSPESSRHFFGHLE